MTFPSIRSALNAGELSPSIYGRVDLAKYDHGLSTCRNFIPSFRGGAFSRAGKKFVGIAKQGNKGRADVLPPPRNITFAFSITQEIVLEFGEQYLRFVTGGGYILEPTKAITAITLATAAVVTIVGHGYSDGDELFLANIGGMPQLSNRSFEIAFATADTFIIFNPLDGGAISTVGFHAYTGGGTAARIYTIATPYAAADLKWLKPTQSADVMSICCVNQDTGTEYPPYDLARITSTNWTLTKTSFAASIAAPATMNVSFSTSAGTASFYYTYAATAVDAKTGQESQASPLNINPSVDIATQAGTHNLLAGSVAGAGSYNFYAATPTYLNPPAGGLLLGYIGTALGPAFSDTNITPDFAKSPPLHRNPFATASVLAVPMNTQGTTYSNTQTTATATSPIGDNAALTPIVIGGRIQWIAVLYGGAGYTGGELVNIVDASGGGSGASASLAIGAATGTFPGVPAYFQERRVYAATKNNPDTYYMSQPGAFTNFDVSDPVNDGDAITGTPWSQQINGIQWMLNMPGGLVVFTGLGAWQVSGAGSGLATLSAITPANQVANPQAYVGSASTVPPIPIDYDILFVQSKQSIVRDLSYNFFVNIYTGTDLTVLSDHLFTSFTIEQWAWARKPYKLLWAVRNDGNLLCLTFLKEQDVYAWSRHDTNGLYQSVCVVSEPPVDAPYFITKRLIQNNGNPVWVYMQERMDDRLWEDDVEMAWCVDAGLQTALSEPAATLTVSSASGVLTLQQPTIVYGGAGYSTSTYARIVDIGGSGRDAIAGITVGVGGVITAAVVGGTLTGYTLPVFEVVDPTNSVTSAASINIQSLPLTTVSASAPVFANAPGQGEALDVIRMQGRIMSVYQYIGPQTLVAVVERNDGPMIPDDIFLTAVPAKAGDWSIAAPIITVYGLNHLEGMVVSILADGAPVYDQFVQNGTVTLPRSASLITVGLGYTCQLQTLYLNIPGPGGSTIQGRRKQIDQATLRVVSTAFPLEVGANQPDAAVAPGNNPPPWGSLITLQSVASPGPQPVPIEPGELFTGDVYTNIIDTLDQTGGQLAIQQKGPLPVNISALVSWGRIGEDADEGR